MPSDRDSDEAEEVIEGELNDSSTRQQRDEHHREAVATAQEQVTKTRETSKLSEAAVDLTFAFFEASFSIVAVILVVLTATTSLPLYTASGLVCCSLAYLKW